MLVGGKTFKGLATKRIGLEKIQTYPFICLGKETMTYQFYNQIFGTKGVELKPDTEVATTDQILALVKHELGLGFLPEPMAKREIEEHRIIQIPLKDKIPERKVCMIYDVKRPMGVAAQKLKKILMEDKQEDR